MISLKHRIEYAGLVAVFGLFRLLPLDVASWLGGRLARTIGPFLGAHRTAEKNLQEVMPDMTATKRKRVLRDMWDNLGRVAAEMPHVASGALRARTTLHGGEHITAHGQVLFFSAHLGNWETQPIYLSCGGSSKLTIVYRAANNPLVDAVINRIRASQATSLAPKGHKGAISLVRAIKGGHSIAMLVDQKMNDGISVPFFGRPAMTAPAIAEFALRYNLPILSTHAVRKKGCYFEVIVGPPLTFEKTGDQERDVLAIMTQINIAIESWIREHPEQWFWVHKRWPKA